MSLPDDADHSEIRATYFTDRPLVGGAVGLPVGELRKRVEHWVEQVGSDTADYLRSVERSSQTLTLRSEGDGVRLSGWFDRAAGERLRAELDPGPPAAEDDRSVGARRADALLSMLSGVAPRPSLIVHVSVERLAGVAEGISETATGTFLTVDEVRRLACDASFHRVILGPESKPLDVGRKKRVVPDWIRAAVSARDLRCVFPGCDRPSNWCDAHHIEHWADGGSTSLDNLILLCRHHHTLVHEVGWKVSGGPGALQFWRPNGEELGTPRRRGPVRFTSWEQDPGDLEWNSRPISPNQATRAIRGP